jgi:hypothetical protein
MNTERPLVGVAIRGSKYYPQVSWAVSLFSCITVLITCQMSYTPFSTPASTSGRVVSMIILQVDAIRFLTHAEARWVSWVVLYLFSVLTFEPNNVALHRPAAVSVASTGSASQLL